MKINLTQNEVKMILRKRALGMVLFVPKQCKMCVHSEKMDETMGSIPICGHEIFENMPSKLRSSLMNYLFQQSERRKCKLYE